MNFLKSFGATMLAIAICTFIAVIVIITSITGLFSSFESSLPVVENNTVLYITFDESIIDSSSASPMGSFDITNTSFDKPVSLLDVLASVERAATDDRIKGICIMPTGVGSINLANIEELRKALLRFKKSGKFIVAYDDTCSQSDYYLMSVADKIILQREGSLDWHGIGFTVMYYKGVMDKLGIQAEIFRPKNCKFKSAVEPFFRKDMSPENRAQMQTIINSWWDDIVSDIAECRNIDANKLKTYAANLSIESAQDAVTAGMIDYAGYEDNLFDLYDEYGVKRNNRGTYNTVTLGNYIADFNITRPRVTVDDDRALSLSTKPLVAIIYAEGEIVDGNMYADGYVYGSRLAEELRHARLDEKTKAVVMRVNSPGGSALASDVAWREMVLLQQTKPVVVSMGDMAASGGYYISTPADYIIADRLTLTGSIGVFGVMYNLGKALTNIAGITFDSALTSPSAGGISPFMPLTDTQRNAINRSVDNVYTTFTSHVAEGRNLSIEHVLSIAEGRVWSGSDALEIGLVDAIGGFNDAIFKAAELADIIDNYEIYEYAAPLTPFEQWIGSMGLVFAEKWGINYDTYGAELRNIISEVPFVFTMKDTQAMLPGNVKKVF